ERVLAGPDDDLSAGVGGNESGLELGRGRNDDLFRRRVVGFCSERAALEGEPCESGERDPCEPACDALTCRHDSLLCDRPMDPFPQPTLRARGGPSRLGIPRKGLGLAWAIIPAFLSLREAAMRIRFGECVLDSGTRQLLVRGEAVHLQPKA